MNTAQHFLLKYEYQINSRLEQDGKYRGLAIVVGYAATQYTSPVEIPTPKTFDSARSAEIEAAAVISYLILKGGISDLVPQNEVACSSSPADSDAASMTSKA